MKIYMTAGAKEIIEKMGAEDSTRLFEELKRYREEDASSHKSSMGILNLEHKMDMRIIVGHPLIKEPFLKLDLPMTEHHGVEPTGKRIMAFFKAGRERNENIDDPLYPLELDQ